MNPPSPPFTVSPSTYTGVVYPGGENDGLPDPVFQGLTVATGLRIDGDPNNSGFSAWWEWTFPEPLPDGAFLMYDIQWTSDANYVDVTLLGDGAPFPDNVFSMGPRSFWSSGWFRQDLRGAPLPAGITTLRYEMSAEQSGAGYMLSAIFQRMQVYIDTPAVPSGGDSYDPGDVVRHNDATWLAVTSLGIGEEPGVAAGWVLLARDGMNYQGDWPVPQ